jgi:hypothetical protein
MVSPDSIGKKGRAVRCASCKHEWFQKSEKDTLDDLISRIQAEEFDEIGFQESGSPIKQGTTQGIPYLSNLFARIVAHRARINYWAFKKRQTIKSGLRKLLSIFPQSKQDIKKIVGGAILAVLTFAILGGGTLLSHNLISNIFPETESVFEKFGLEHKSAAINYNESLALDRMEYSLSEDETGAAFLRGMMINLTDEEIVLPSLEINRLDEKGNVLHSQTYTFPEEKIEPEGQIGIEIALAEITPLQVSAREVIPKAQKIEVFYTAPPSGESADSMANDEDHVPAPNGEKAASKPEHQPADHDLPKPFEGVTPSPDAKTPAHNTH